MCWREEFGDGYAVPETITSQLHDVSWHNDLSPSFVASELAPAAYEKEEARLWVGHPDPAIRAAEWGAPVPRFNVLDPECEEAFWTDDPDVAVAELRRRQAAVSRFDDVRRG